MMDRKTRNYTEEGVVRDLNKKADIRIIGKQIQHNRGESAKGDVGNGSKGKIDFLLKYHGYTHFYVNGFKNY